MKRLIFICVAVAFSEVALSESETSSSSSATPVTSTSSPQKSPGLCAGTLGALCRSQHSMRRLKDGRVLIAGGKFGETPAGDLQILDLSKRTLKLLESVDIERAIGFRVDDNWYAFTDRLQEDNSVEPPNYQAWDKIVFVDITKKTPPFTILIRQMNNASTPVLTRIGGEPHLILFFGHERRNDCYGDDAENGVCLQRYAVEAYQLKLDNPAKYAEQGELFVKMPYNSTGVELHAGDKSNYYEQTTNLDSFAHLDTLKRARAQFDVSVMPDGKMFVAGGREQANDNKLEDAETAEYYLPGKGWFETAPLPGRENVRLRTFTVSDKEVLAVNLDNGESWTWSFDTKKWKSAFKIGAPIAKGMMHSNGDFLALAKQKNGKAQLHVCNLKTGKVERIGSPMNFESGASIIELADKKVLETQDKGAQIWDIKAKTATQVKL